MNNKKRIVLIGATSAIAEQCARLWAQNQTIDLTLIGRDASRLKRVSDDLNVRSPQSDIQTLSADFLDPIAIEQTVDGIMAKGPVDIVLIAHGALPEQTHCQDNLAASNDALAINGVSPVLYAEAFAKHMAKTNHGTLAIIGSVAGDRGRKSNYVYGAAKALVASYAEGLQHRFAGTGVRIVLIKPGPTDTPMTAHLKKHGAKLASVTDVAIQIVAAIEAGKPMTYTPIKWRFIMFMIRHIPRIMFNKINI